ncbi:hypothetical protein Hanom_Chr10g00958681 [Helianthus anomalus]
MMANSDSELDSNSNSESDSDDDRVDMEDMEEGEISPIVQNDSEGQDVGINPVTGVKEVGQADDGAGSPVANEQSHEGEGSPTPRKDQEFNSNMGNLNLHGEENNSAHVHCHEECGPNGINGLHNQLGSNEGPTSVNCLGKRHGADRSPPSLGSIQGPSQRLFGQSERSNSISLDLYTPIGEVLELWRIPWIHLML